jgi:DMSO/TMAO reductase YedYZ molybdopterin-dependent catalytic subunit
VENNTRRRFLRQGSLAVIGAFIGCDSNKIEFRQMPMAPSTDRQDGFLPAPPITSNEAFYLQSIFGASWDPQLSSDAWFMGVKGLVEWPIERLTYAQITALPLERQVMTMQCIGNWIGGPLLGNAEWGGTPLNNILDMAQVNAEAIGVKFTCIDGYTTAISLERARRAKTLLVWEMNREALPSLHGFPIRLINPGHYGQKMPKWITHIELIDHDFLGYWESRPSSQQIKWSNDALASVDSRIDVPFSIWDDQSDAKAAQGPQPNEIQRIEGARGDFCDSRSGDVGATYRRAG